MGIHDQDPPFWLLVVEAILLGTIAGFLAGLGFASW